MKILPVILVLALALPLAGCAHQARGVSAADAPRALEADGPVTVAWTDPEQFAEIRFSGNRQEARRGDWVRQLADHLRAGTEARIANGERVEILVTDIRRAGNFEPGRGPQLDHIRMLRDIHWPRMNLEFRHFGANGQLLAEGTRELRDMSYLTSSPRQPTNTDPLRYEKAMLDRWLDEEFGRRR